MGVATLLRWKHAEPFDDDDQLLAEELAARAAVCIDNARRYTREHNTALALQRSLLPHGLPEQSAVEVGLPLPARRRRSRGRRRLVRRHPAVRRPGRPGRRRRRRPRHPRRRHHGPAAHRRAHPRRPRPAPRRAAHPPRRPGRSGSPTKPMPPADGAGVIGATCLYAVYDPVSRRCTLARAGHPSARHGRTGRHQWTSPTCRPARRWAWAACPSRSAEIDLAEGSVLALYTDGLIEARDRDVDVGFERLCCALAHPDRPLEEICDTMVRMPAARAPARRRRPAPRPHPRTRRRPRRLLGPARRPRSRRTPSDSWPTGN